MDQFLGPPIDFEEEVVRINEEIELHQQRIEELESRRYGLITRKQNLDMDFVLEYIVKNELSSNEVMEIIIEALEKRKASA